MGKRKRSLLFVLGVLPLSAALLAIHSGGPTVVHAKDPNKAPAAQRHLWDSAAVEAAGDEPSSEGKGTNQHGSSAQSDYQPSGAAGECPVSLGSNVKVNQECVNISYDGFHGRGQAHNETAIAANPNNQNQLVAASNDYKLGDGLDGGTHYSTDGGKTWQNSEVPLGFSRGSDFNAGPQNQCSDTPEPGILRMYWQGAGDPSVAWDTKGNVYFAHLAFHRGVPVSENPDFSSGIFVERSTQNGGASWNFPGTAAVTCSQPAGDVTGSEEDKPYIAIDDGSSPSSHTDRIYVTWTFFKADGTAYIYEANSSDYGRTFGAPVLVSENSSLCTNNYSFNGVTPEKGNNCDENQFSNPFVGPDGTLYVTYVNTNTAAAQSSGDNAFQILLSKSTDGGASFGAPVKVGNYYDVPDCPTYQGGQGSPGFGCIPEQGSQQESIFRAANYPTGGFNPTNPSQIVVTYGSYINKDSNENTGCVPAGTTGAAGAFTALYSGVKTAACSNKILVSLSNDGGSTFTGTTTDPRSLPVVPQAGSQAHTDQWWQWQSFASDGRLVVSYYDRSYDSDITNGNSDVTLSASQNKNQLLDFTNTRVTTSSMPAPTEFPDAQGNGVFLGDYSGLVVTGRTAHPLWSDTRDLDFAECSSTGPPAVCTFNESGSDDQANQEDIYTDSISINGGGGGGH